MKEIVVNQKYGIVVYEENDWTGARSVTFSNYLLVNVDKETYTFNDGEEIDLADKISNLETPRFFHVKELDNNYSNFLENSLKYPKKSVFSLQEGSTDVTQESFLTNFPQA